MQDMARFGRNGDTQMAHVAPGETIVPAEILANNPTIARGIGMAFEDAGLDPLRYVVDSGQNSLNPVTGQPEFFLKDLFDMGKKFLGSNAGKAVATNVVTSLLTGNKPSLKEAAISGLLGQGLGSLGGGEGREDFLSRLLGQAEQESKVPLSAFGGSNGNKATESIIKSAMARSRPAAVNTGYKDDLLGIGELFGLDAGSGLGRMLNSKAGEAIAMGLGSMLLDKVIPKEEVPDYKDEAGPLNRPYGEGRLKIKQRPIRVRDDFQERVELNEGGPAYYPRRDGGIMPHEGSGTEDDVPALLTAGEFVMTREAVEGAGNGDVNKGIKNMYGLMNKLEGQR